MRAFSHENSINQTGLAQSTWNMSLKLEELHDAIEAMKLQRSRTRGPDRATDVLEAIISLCSRIAARAADGPVAQTARAMRASAITLYAADKSAAGEIRDLLEESIAQLEQAVSEDRGARY